MYLESDFESAASASSAIPAGMEVVQKLYQLPMRQGHSATFRKNVSQTARRLYFIATTSGASRVPIFCDPWSITPRRTS
jgi:hypothetical protein